MTDVYTSEDILLGIHTLLTGLDFRVTAEVLTLFTPEKKATAVGVDPMIYVYAGLGGFALLTIIIIILWKVCAFILCLLYFYSVKDMHTCTGGLRCFYPFESIYMLVKFSCNAIIFSCSRIYCSYFAHL